MPLPQAQPSSDTPKQQAYERSRDHRWGALFWAVWIASLSAMTLAYIDPDNTTLIWVALGLLLASLLVALRSLFRGFQ